MRKKTMFKAVATVTIFSVITRTFSFIFKIYLSHTAGAAVMGLYQICLSLFFLFSALCSSGITTVLSRMTAERRAIDNDDKGFSLLTSSLIISGGMALLTVTLLYLATPLLDMLITDKRALPLFKIMLPALISSSIYYSIRSWFWGSKQYTSFSMTEMLEEVLRILFTLLFFSGVIGGINGEYGIALAFTVSDVLVAIILIIMYFYKGGRLRKPTDLKIIIKPALPLTAMRVFGSLIGTLLAVILPLRLIVGGYSVEEATASFGRVAGMANPLLFAPNAIISSLAVVLIPEMSESGIKKDVDSLAKHLNHGIVFALLVSGLFLIPFAAVGKEITTLLFNDIISGEYLETASWLLLIMPIHQLTASCLNSIGMEKESFLSYLISTAFMVGSIYLLTPIIGILSVVIANMLTLIICTGGNLYFLNKKVNLRLPFVKPFVLITIFVFPCILLTSNLASLFSSIPLILSLILSCGIGSIMYLILVSIFGIVDVTGMLKIRKS